MKLAVAALLVPAVTHAATLVEYSGTEQPRPSHDVVEAACDMDVRIDAGVATVETRQRFANRGAVATAAAYELDLPAGAKIVGVTLRGDTSTETGVAVATGFGNENVADADVLGADPVVVQLVGDAHYRVTLEPLAPDHEVVLATKWIVPVTVRNGSLRVDLPGRASSGALVPCHGTVKAAAGPGAKIDKIRGGDKFVLGDRDLAIDAELAFARAEPLVWTQREDLGDGWTGALVTVLAPPAKTSAPIARRTMFVIDGSRSMDMVGSQAVGKVVDAVAAALPAGTELDAIIYDRKAARVVGKWETSDRALPAIRTALSQRSNGNGSDLTAALALAHTAIADGARGETSVVIITDGVLGQLPDMALEQALASKPSAVDVHAIVLDPAGATSPGEAELVRPVGLYGGTYVEVAVGDLDAALDGVDSWVRPSWVDLELTGAPKPIPATLRAGSGASIAFVYQGTAPSLSLVAHGDTPLDIKPRDAGAASFAAIALDADVHAREHTKQQLVAKHPAVDAGHAFVVLATDGKVARSRRQMVAGGGPFTRTVALADPSWPPYQVVTKPVAQPTAIDRSTVERLFRNELQPAAYVCYQHALGPAPKLGGTVHFEFHMSRGEVTHVDLVGLGNDEFDACVLDAGYKLSPPLPDFSLNSDDQTIVHYQLTFNLHEEHPVVVLGDADSESPLDIDAIEGGVPGPIKVDARTPLGGLKKHP